MAEDCERNNLVFFPFPHPEKWRMHRIVPGIFQCVYLSKQPRNVFDRLGEFIIEIVGTGSQCPSDHLALRAILG